MSVVRPEAPQRLADLWWLMAHDERGNPRVGREHLALGLSAAALGELLTQSCAVVTDEGLAADLVVAHPLADMVEATARGITKPPRAWVEWLAADHHDRTASDVTARLTGAGRLVLRGRRLAPVDALTSFAPVGALVSALGGGGPVPEVVRLLAGLCCCCGLAPLVATGSRTWCGRCNAWPWASRNPCMAWLLVWMTRSTPWRCAAAELEPTPRKGAHQTRTH